MWGREAFSVAKNNSSVSVSARAHVDIQKTKSRVYEASPVIGGDDVLWYFILHFSISFKNLLSTTSWTDFQAP